MLDPRLVALGLGAALCAFESPLLAPFCSCASNAPTCAGSVSARASATFTLQNATLVVQGCGASLLDSDAFQVRGRCWFAVDADNATEFTLTAGNASATLWVVDGMMPFYRPPMVTPRAFAAHTTSIYVVTRPDVSAASLLSAIGPSAQLARLDEGTFASVTGSDSNSAGAAAALAKTRWPASSIVTTAGPRTSFGLFCAASEPCFDTTTPFPPSVDARWNSTEDAMAFTLGESDASTNFWEASAVLLVGLQNANVLLGFSTYTAPPAQTPQQKWWWPLQISIIGVGVLGVIGNLYQGKCGCGLCLRCFPCLRVFLDPDKTAKAPPSQADGGGAAQSGAPRIVIMR